MTNSIEVFDKIPFDSIKVIINGEIIASSENTTSIFASYDTLPAEIVVEFTPEWRRPKIRLNEHLVNWFHAKVQFEQYCFKISMPESFEVFASNYVQSDIDGRLHYFKDQIDKSEQFYDKYIGIKNLYPDLVAEIKSLLSKNE
jgi:hypothetical protein